MLASIVAYQGVRERSSIRGRNDSIVLAINLARVPTAGATKEGWPLVPELILRTQLPNGETLIRPLSDAAVLPAEAGATYTILDAETEQAPVGLEFDRKDQDLEIQLEGETVVVLDDFYTADMAATFSADRGLTTGEFALSSADLPAVSEAGGLDADLPHVSDGGFFSIPAGATLLNPATWGTGALVGAGTVVAAGVGTGVGIALDDDDDDDVDPTTVVFDLAESGNSSDHSNQEFNPDVSYTIYIRVPSQGGLVELNAGEQWTGVRNLGEDDVIVLVGTGADVEGVNGAVTSASGSSSGIWWWDTEENVASMYSTGYFYRQGITTTTETGTSMARVAATETTTTSASVYLWNSESSWSENPNSDNTFSEIYMTALPGGVLTSQGLA